jgi:hypothetical protein
MSHGGLKRARTGNGGYSQRKPTAYRDSSTRKVVLWPGLYHLPPRTRAFVFLFPLTAGKGGQFGCPAYCARFTRRINVWKRGSERRGSRGGHTFRKNSQGSFSS